ncbi:hypothetical protein ALC152_05060 [Arcobacter sp. 15-2]|uniref:conjugal transfer protein TraH n=1 Tax=Arcobacter sp. 15-2 TaxID=3374109 RepID=UPI00399CD535
MKKKIINLSLIAVLSLQSVASAGSFQGTTNYGGSDIMKNMLFNHTPSKSVQFKDSNGNTIKSMYYSGGYYFRFNNDVAPQPLWAFSPPEIEAGCNGFNLKGMFMSLLGIDQFGAMLQNAGTSLAWGVAVGLIYSLPGVASVFKMINQWAKDIQKLLSMACSSGIQIGEQIGKKLGDAVGYDKEAVEKSLRFGLSSDSVANGLQKGIKTTLKDGLGLDGVDFSWDSGFSFGGGDEASEKKKKEAVSLHLSKIFGDYSVGGSIMFDYIMKSKTTLDTIKNELKSEKSPIFYRTISLDYSSGDGNFNNNILEESIDNVQSKIVSPTDKVSFGMKLLSYTFFYNFGGDLGYTRDMADTVIKRLGDMYSCSSATDMPSSSCSPDEKANNDKALIEALSNPSFTIKVSPVGKVRVPTGAEMKDIVLLGYSEQTKEILKDLVAPEFLVISTEEKDKSEKNFIITPTEPKERKPFFDSNKFAGAKIISQCSLYNSLKGIIPENYIGGLSVTGDSSVDCNNVPLIIFPGVELYADILSKAIDTEITEGIRKMNEVNLYLTANSILDQIGNNLSVSRVGTTKLTTNMIQNNPSSSAPVLSVEANDVYNSISNFKQVIDDAKSELDKEYPFGRKGVNELQKYFQEIEKNIKKRALENQK